MINNPEVNRQDQKNEVSLRESIQNLSSTLLDIIHEIFNLASLELRLAVKSVIAISLLLLFAGLFIISAWLCLLAALAFWLFSITFSWPLAILIVAFLNLLILPLVFFCISQLRQHLFFSATRNQIASIKDRYETTSNPPNPAANIPE